MKRKLNYTGCRKFFGKGYRDVEFHISCFQSWDTSPTEVVIDMFVSNLKGKKKLVITDTTQMTDMGRVDAVAYRMYYTALMMEEYQLQARYNRIGRVTYIFSDIGPYLWASEQMNPHNKFQRFNRYYFKNKLSLMNLRKIKYKFEDPDDSKLLAECVLRRAEKAGIQTDETLGLAHREYLRDTIRDREYLGYAHKG